MVAISDMLTIRQQVAAIERLLHLLNTGGYTEPLDGTFVQFTPAQLATITSRIDTQLVTLQTLVAGLIPL